MLKVRAKSMKQKIYIIIFVLAAIVFGGFLYIQFSPVKAPNNFSSEAADPTLSSFESYYRGRVTALGDINNETLHSTTFKAILLTDNAKDKEVEVEYTPLLGTTNEQLPHVGETIVIGELKAQPGMGGSYVYLDKYRITPILSIIAIFLALAIIFGRWRGVTATIGLTFSIFLLIYFIAPGILAGKDAGLVSLVGAGLIAIISIYFAHGFNERSGLATISTFITLGVSVGLSYWFVNWSKLFGMGMEGAFLLQSGYLGNVDLKGLLLAGVIIGTIGILDDVTTSQTATIAEISEANNSLGFKELFRRGSIVGREHIASLINTLVLAYAGAVLPLFLLFTLLTNQPLWTIINSEFVAEEIIRTLVGSCALILAVPITTIFASYYFGVQIRPKNR